MTKPDYTKVFLTRFALRKSALGLSDRQVARLVGKDSTTISRRARGQGEPRLSELFALARVLKCSVAWLIGQDQEAPPRDVMDAVSYERGYRAAYAEIRAALRHQANAGRILGNSEKSRKRG